jgi:hypothetical protein
MFIDQGLENCVDIPEDGLLQIFMSSVETAWELLAIVIYLDATLLLFPEQAF